MTSASFIASLVPNPPGTNNTSRSSGQSSKVVVGQRATPLSVATGCRFFHNRKVLPFMPSAACGPARSSSVKPG